MGANDGLDVAEGASDEVSIASVGVDAAMTGIGKRREEERSVSRKNYIMGQKRNNRNQN